MRSLTSRPTSPTPSRVGDTRYGDICTLIRKTCAEQDLPVPEIPEPPPFVADPIEQLDLRRFGAVIFTSGYRPDYKSWMRFADDAFDHLGFPVQVDGSSVRIPGLHFMGVHFQRKRKSSSLLGVAEDAAVLAERIITNARHGARSGPP